MVALIFNARFVARPLPRSLKPYKTLALARRLQHFCRKRLAEWTL